MRPWKRRFAKLLGAGPQEDLADSVIGDYMALSGWQERAVGRVEPSIEDETTRLNLSCAGTVVAANWVLTAAHCYWPGGDPYQFVVIGGDGHRIGGWPARRVIEHPSRDLVLLELDAAPESVAKLVAPIPVAELELEIQLGESLQLVTFNLKDSAIGGRRQFPVEPITELTNGDIVVDGQGRSGACGGDSGGPLLGRGSDGTVRVLASLVEGAADCLGMDRYARLRDTDPFIADHLPSDCQEGACGELDETGQCIAGRAVWCEAGVAVSHRCDPNEECSWDASAGGYRCLRRGFGPCPGTDPFGVCVDGVAQWCANGNLVRKDCIAQGRTCIRGSDGYSGCE